MADLLRFFDKYVSLGLQPIAISRSSKAPFLKAWNIDWSVDRWRPLFETTRYNMGILLGNVVDVEGDSAEANDLLFRMIDGLPHPMFSSRKSIHHLFRADKLLAYDPTFTRKSFNGTEFRGPAHFSVVPPSIHPDGPRYRWLEQAAFPIPDLPDELVEYYIRCLALRDEKPQPKTKQLPPPPKKYKKKGFSRTECNLCHKKFYIHKKRLILEVRGFREEFGQKWRCHGCREFDMRDICRSVRKQMEREANQPFVPVLRDEYE